MFRFSGKVVSEKYHIQLFEAVRLIYNKYRNRQQRLKSRRNDSGGRIQAQVAAIRVYFFFSVRSRVESYRDRELSCSSMAGRPQSGETRIRRYRHKKGFPANESYFLKWDEESNRVVIVGISFTLDCVLWERKEMKDVFKNYLFHHAILVGKIPEKSSTAFETEFALAKLFHIQITEGEDLLNVEVIRYVEKQLGQNVPEPFYRGFPKSVRVLTSEQRFFDQIVHYMHTYRMGFLSERGHSILEDYIQRNAFDEDCEIRCFSVMTEAAVAA